MNIKVKSSGRLFTLNVDDNYFTLNEAELRRLRAEANRGLQELHDRRERQKKALAGDQYRGADCD